jgi:uncharacterized protein involved in tolerance to divalent cations
MSTQFDLEQQIMDCWGIVDDLKSIYSSDTLFEDSDEVPTILMGISKLYHLKFDQLFQTFEKMLKEIGKIEPYELADISPRETLTPLADRIESMRGINKPETYPLTPEEMLESYAERFEYAGVSETVAKHYAKEIREFLKNRSSPPDWEI